MGRLAFGVALASLVAAHPVSAQPSGLTLSAAVGEALASSPRLAAPDDGRILASIRARQVESQQDFRITPSLHTGTDPQGYSQRDVGVGVTRRLPTGTNVLFRANMYRFGAGPVELKDAGYTIGFSQPLLRGFGAESRRDRTLARQGVTSAERQYEDARADLVLNVARAYHAVLKQLRLAANGARALERARALGASSKARARVGLATELDVLRADLLAAQAEAATAGAHEALEDARDALRVLIGWPLDREVDLAEADLSERGLRDAGLLPEDAEPDPGDEPAALDRLTHAALASRRDLQEARERIGEARLNESVARWNLLPPVSFDLAYTRRGLGASTAVFGQLLNGWRYGFSTTYALDHADEQAASAAALVAVRAAEREALDTEQRVRTDVRRAYRAWQQSTAAIGIQTRAVDIAERQARLADMRFDRGLGSNLEVIDAETNLYQAQAALVSAQIDRALAGLAARRVSGTLNPDRYAR